MNSNSCGLEDRHYRQEGNYYWLSAAAKDDPKLAGYISKCGVFAQLDITVEHLSARATANLLLILILMQFYFLLQPKVVKSVE